MRKLHRVRFFVYKNTMYYTSILEDFGEYISKITDMSLLDDEGSQALRERQQKRRQLDILKRL